ncbi:WYL domain-containing protein [Periweissella cryptocerci]|uniref:WYL domain-containing protein n=1 Tax=Periweissella cryptocerci TaxID=2506420 RepID=A0A4V1AIM2_9LACO|nr:WYL domain-containing protein [Periweissella cryptocerci]QBO35995.1 WYL domain-containing protein [Periweissella cryptocerci]
MTITATMRPVAIFMRLLNGDTLNKQNLADEYAVNLRTIQRDISNLNALFANEISGYAIEYNSNLNGYELVSTQHNLTSREVFLLLKMIVENHSLNANEFNRVKDGLINLIPPTEWTKIQPLVIDEIANYHPIKHGKDIIDLIWTFSTYIKQKKTVAVTYQRMDNKVSAYDIYPQAITMDEYYFYILAYSEHHPTSLASYRIDRIQTHEIVGTAPNTHTPLVSDSDFKQRSPFMFSGTAEVVQFQFYGKPEAALDQFTSSRIVETLDDSVIIEIKSVNERGTLMWLLSQGSSVKVLQPQCFVDNTVKMLKAQLERYEC